MTTVQQVLGSRTSLAYSSTSLSALASATFVQNTTAYPCNTNKPLDVVIEGSFGVGSAPGSNKQVLIYVRESLDGSAYRSGPTSGTGTTDEPNLLLVGVVPILSASVTQRGSFSLLKALGYIPYDFFVVVKNEAGQALNVGTIYTSEVSEQF